MHRLTGIVLVVISSAAEAQDARPLKLAIAVDGPSVQVTPKQRGVPVQVAFDGKAGQRLSIVVSDVRMAPASASGVLVSVRDPQDREVPTTRIHCLAAPSTVAAACKGEMVLAGAGKHVIEVDTPFSAVASFSLALNTAAAPKPPAPEGSVVVGGAPVAFSTAGATGPLTFAIDLQAGQAIAVGIDALAHDPPDVDSNSALRVTGPDGSMLAGVGCRTRPIPGMPGGGGMVPCKVLLPSVPAAGRYRITIRPPAGASAAGRLVVSGQASPSTGGDSK